MKLSTRQDIEAPIEFVFEHAADFDTHMLQAMRRGIEVRRTDSLDGVGEGMHWNVVFDYRGKQRQLNGELIRLEAPERLHIHSVSGGIESAFEVEFLALSRNRTRLRAGLDLRPKTVPARLLIQSLRLGKHRLNDGFAKRFAQFAEEVEARFAGAPRL